MRNVLAQRPKSSTAVIAAAFFSMGAIAGYGLKADNGQRDDVAMTAKVMGASLNQSVPATLQSTLPPSPPRARRDPLADPMAQARADRAARMKRMREDDAYALQVEKERLAALEAEFSREPVDHAWSTMASQHLNDSVAAAANDSLAKIKQTDIRCRSQTCSIRIDMEASSSHEDLLMYLTTNMAELLPHARLVVLPPAQGLRQVNIYADKGMAQDHNPGRDEA
ncbi:hypothetical protein [Marilutibacter chinensis]|uniref:Uncharacterized protein n=1 Tax=Marilutibacter chinensis TaxID=2912247 RepID=A0ABS9HT30_9GAMM|nr:hypothetical protein [Lysobacter chinensis]MCF7221312.1 hypothetical protein [Lysobacter chinensis]